MPKLLFLSLLISSLYARPVNTNFKIGGVIKAKDFNGNSYTITPDAKPVVYIFLSPECPLCQNYAPIVQALADKYKGIQFFGVVSGSTFTKEAVAAYARDYKIKFPLLKDTDKKIAHELKATVTPEALLIGKKGKEYYRGLIDDWVTGLGTKRFKANSNFLDQAIINLITGSEEVYSTKPIGCFISNY